MSVCERSFLNLQSGKKKIRCQDWILRMSSQGAFLRMLNIIKRTERKGERGKNCHSRDQTLLGTRIHSSDPTQTNKRLCSTTGSQPLTIGGTASHTPLIHPTQTLLKKRVSTRSYLVISIPETDNVHLLELAVPHRVNSIATCFRRHGNLNRYSSGLNTAHRHITNM